MTDDVLRCPNCDAYCDVCGCILAEVRRTERLRLATEFRLQAHNETEHAERAACVFAAEMIEYWERKRATRRAM